MKITVEHMRLAGIPAELIVRACEFAEAEAKHRAKELAGERQKRWRASKRPAPPTGPPPVDAGRRLQTSTYTIDPLWVLPEEGVQYARDQGWPAERITVELIRFKDHAASKGRTSADWLAAWRLWVTSPYQKGVGNGNGSGRRLDEWEAAFEQLGAAAGSVGSGSAPALPAAGQHSVAAIQTNRRR